jgi:mannose-6-phosphate isomerase-like protein (cupin superfamily)
MDKEVAEVIREQRRKEREETKKRRAVYSHNVINKATQGYLRNDIKHISIEPSQHLQLWKHATNFIKT